MSFRNIRRALLLCAATLLAVGGSAAVLTPHAAAYTPGHTQITTLSMPDAIVGNSYLQSINVINGTGSLVFTLSAGSLPTGLSFVAGTGQITGTAITPGTYNFTISVQDNNNQPTTYGDSRAYSLRVVSDQDSVDDAGENSSPNGGDANGDGTPDAQQSYVVSSLYVDPNTSDTIWTTIELPSSSNCILSSPNAFDAKAIKVDSGYSYPYAFMTAFKATCPSPGATVHVTLIFNQTFDTTGWYARFFNQHTQVYTNIPGATFGTRTVGGLPKTTMSYNVTDGGSLDTDGTANSVIDDPVGIAMPPPAAASTTPPASGSSSSTNASAPNTGLGKESMVPFTLLLIAGGTLVGLAFRPHKHVSRST